MKMVKPLPCQFLLMKITETIKNTQNGRLKETKQVKPSPEETKQAIKEGLTEWLEDKFSEFGKLSLKAILALLVAALVYFWAASQGWKI